MYRSLGKPVPVAARPGGVPEQAQDQVGAAIAGLQGRLFGFFTRLFVGGIRIAGIQLQPEPDTHTRVAGRVQRPAIAADERCVSEGAGLKALVIGRGRAAVGADSVIVEAIDERHAQHYPPMVVEGVVSAYGGDPVIGAQVLDLAIDAGVRVDFSAAGAQGVGVAVAIAQACAPAGAGMAVFIPVVVRRAKVAATAGLYT